MPIARDQIPAQALPREEVALPSLGGTVWVQGMDVRQLLAFTAARRRAQAQRDGETEDDAAERAGGELVPLLLATCVLADDGLPVYTAAQWAAWMVRNGGEAAPLWQAALRLSGQDPNPNP